MYAVIVGGVVVELRETDTLGPEESAIVVECGDEVRPGWRFEGGEFAPAPEPDPYAVEPEYLDLGQVSIGHAERLYAAAQAEGASTAGDGPATVLLEMLGL